MAYNADSVVVELVADVSKFDGPVKSSASKFDSSMKQIEGSANRMSAAQFRAAGGVEGLTKSLDKVSHSSGTARAAQMELQHVARAAGDQFAAGTPVMQIFSQHLGQVAQAATLSGSALGKVGLFLGGPWGIALTLATVVLSKFAFGNKEADDSVESLTQKLKDNAEKTENNRRAQEIFGSTIEGVTAALDANQKALDDLNKTDDTAARKALVAAAGQAIHAQRIRETTLALLKQAEAQIQVLQAQAGVGGGSLRDTGASAEARQVEGRLAGLRAQIDQATKELGRAHDQVQQALSSRVVELAQEQADPIKRINKLYDDRIEQARQQALREKTVTTELNKQVQALEAQRRAALKAEQDRKRIDNSNQQSGRQINLAQARSIVAGIGGTVTSGFRSVAHNEDVGGVKGSFHTKGQALDIAKTAGMTLGKIVKAFEKAGVHLIEKLDEGDHFHVAFGKRGGARGPSAETLAKRAQAAADASERRQQAYDNELAAMQDSELQARQDLVTSAEEIAKLEMQAIEVARQKYNDNLASLVTQRKLTADEAAELEKINNERAKLRAELVARREAERKFRMQEQARQNAVELASAQLQNQADLLHGQEQLATTQRERRDIERRLLDLQFQEERIRLQAIISFNERLKLQKNIADSERIEAEAAAQIAKLKLESIDQRQANATAASDMQTASPLQQYFGDIQSEADDINDAFERIAAGGLATFVDSLTDAIVNFRSLGDVGRAVLANITAALVKLAIQQIILAVVGKGAQAAATAATAAQMAAIGAAAAGPAALVSLATSGANAIGANAGMASAAALAALIGAPKAMGGRIYGPGSSTSDSVPIRASADEFMIRASSAKQLGYSALDHMNRTGQFPAFASGGRIRSVSPLNMAASAPGGGRGGFSSNDIATLRDIVGQAAAAVPAVNLYASLDPADMLQRALGTVSGEKALLAALGRNSGRVKATIG